MEYKTISGAFEIEYEEKKSKFIGNITDVKSENEAIEFISQVKSKYWDAAHNVYAYKIVENNIAVQKFSDDGEPSGTAGLPVLNVLKKKEVRDVCIVVTRYFGGILLGASGLVRAYSKSASSVIDAAGIVRKILCKETKIIIEYTKFDKIRNFILANNFKIDNIIYGQDVEIICYIPTSNIINFESKVNDLANGSILIEFGKKLYINYRG